MLIFRHNSVPFTLPAANSSIRINVHSFSFTYPIQGWSLFKLLWYNVDRLQIYCKKMWKWKLSVTNPVRGDASPLQQSYMPHCNLPAAAIHPKICLTIELFLHINLLWSRLTLNYTVFSYCLSPSFYYTIILYLIIL